MGRCADYVTLSCERSRERVHYPGSRRSGSFTCGSLRGIEAKDTKSTVPARSVDEIRFEALELALEHLGDFGG